MKKTIALLLLVLPLLSVAQITFQPGYFIESGVKNECLIKNIAWKNNPTSIEYKLNDNDETKTKTIDDISEFSVNNTYKYIRFTVNIDRSETLLDRLSPKKEPEWNKETLLLKVLVEGKITLYQYEESNLVKYFFSTGDTTQAEQLIYKEYKIDNYILKNNAYRQQLYNLMKDVNPDMKKYENISYKQESLVKLFTEYNGSNGQKAVNLSERQNKTAINVKITPGVSFTSVAINNSMSETEYDFSSKIGFRIGAEFEYVLPFNNNKWALFIDPNYQSYTDEGTRKGVTAAIDYKYIQLPFGVRYFMYLNQKSKIFVEAAYSTSFIIGDSSLSYHKVNVATATPLDLNNFTAISIGTGYAYDRYSVGIRFSSSSGLLKNYSLWESDYTSFNLIFGYKIF